MSQRWLARGILGAAIVTVGALVVDSYTHEIISVSGDKACAGARMFVDGRYAADFKATFGMDRAWVRGPSRQDGLAVCYADGDTIFAAGDSVQNASAKVRYGDHELTVQFRDGRRSTIMARVHGSQAFEASGRCAELVQTQFE
jgi:hypothetical protein